MTSTSPLRLSHFNIELAQLRTHRRHFQSHTCSARHQLISNMLVWELITRQTRSHIHPALTYEPHQACIRARSAPPPARSHAGANSAGNVLCRCCSASAPVRTARWPRPAPPHHPLRQQEWPRRGVPRPPCRRLTHNMDLRMWGAIEEPHMRATSAGFQTQQYIRSLL